MGNKLVAAAGVDPAAEKEGAWFEFSPNGETVFRVRMRRAGTGNPEFMKKQNDLLRPYRAGQRTPGSVVIPPEKDREIMRKLYASTILVDWNADDFGEPFTEANAIAAFAGYNDFLDWCINTSNAAENYRRQEIEDARGN